MKQTGLLLCGLTLLTLAQGAPVPPPEKLLPQDTLAFLTAPDWNKAMADYHKSPGYLLWQDPAMKPFKDKLMTKLNKDMVEPLEKELGIKFADYSGLAQGQFTLAITRDGWEGGKDQKPGLMLLIDAKDKKAQLAQALADLKKKWVDSGKQIKTEKIRDVEFTTLILMSEDLRAVLDKAFPDPNEGWENLSAPPKKKRPNQKIEFIVGQSDSLLIVGSSAQPIEKVLALQAGGGAAPLADLAIYQANHNSLFRDANFFGWINLETLVDTLVKAVPSAPPAGNNPMAVDPKKVISALGLKGLKTAALATRDPDEGTYANLFLGVPQAERKGLFKMLVAGAKDSGPPPFVPADAVSFSRWRLDFQKTWDGLEAMVNEINPALLGTLKFFETAIKQQNPDFDLRQSLIGNLGDDLIVVEKSPRKNTLMDLASQPSLILLGSPDAEKLVGTVTALVSSMPKPGGTPAAKPKEREFLGRKIYSFPPAPQFNLQGQKTGERSLSLCANGGYVAISFDTPLLEEYLRSSGDADKPLRRLPGLMDAAEKVGGMNSGLFGYEDQIAASKTLLEVLKNDAGSFEQIIAMTPIGGRLGMAEDTKLFKDYLDFSLLPDFDKIAKYINFTVYAGHSTAEGLTLKLFTPRPPKMR